MNTHLETPIPDRSVREPQPATQLGTVVVVEAGSLRSSFFARNRTLVWFVGLLVLLDVIVGRFAGTWQKHSPDDYALRVSVCARERRDIVFIGGSPVAEGIDPSRFSNRGSMYSLGLSGGTTSDFYHAVLRGCPQPPKMLVYGITATDINDSRNEPHGPYSLMTIGDVVGWAKTRPESAEWVIRHSVQARIGKMSNLFRYRHAIRMWAATEASELHPESSPETLAEADELREHAELLLNGDGYAPARGHSAMRLDGLKRIGRAPTYLPYLAKYRTGSHLKYLHALIDWCEANGVKLVLVDMPVSADLERIHSAEFIEYRMRLGEAERARGLTVIRAGRAAVGLGDSHFSDLIHLNKDGARRLSDWLAQRSELKQ